jgi:uncharacterized metal-binding protein YceD (DUF177 family)
VQPLPEKVQNRAETKAAGRLHLPLEGEDKVPVDNDCVDLTPFVREDILLEFPQHPLCKPDCGGIENKNRASPKNRGQRRRNRPRGLNSNKLKL